MLTVSLWTHSLSLCLSIYLLLPLSLAPSLSLSLLSSAHTAPALMLDCFILPLQRHGGGCGSIIHQLELPEKAKASLFPSPFFTRSCPSLPPSLPPFHTPCLFPSLFLSLSFFFSLSLAGKAVRAQSPSLSVLLPFPSSLSFSLCLQKM